MKRPVIGFISSSSPTDKRSSSGTAYTIAKQLGRMGTLIWIPSCPSRLYRWLELVVKAFSRCFGKNISFGYTYIGAKLLASNVRTDLFQQCDILFAFFAGSKLGNLNLKNKPLIYLSDATFPAMINYYPPFCNLWKWNIRQGIALEKRSLDKADALIFSSDWSAKSAMKDLGQSVKKIHVIEFGANIEEKDISIKTFVCNNHIDLLFLGVEWRRKGGDIAVEATRWLNEHGVSATLHIVGIRNLSDAIKTLSYVDYIGFLNKNNPEEYDQLIQIIRSCHALLLPTVAECSAISFAEASAYGLPVYTYDTGGVSNYIQNGRNGYMLPLGSSGAAFGMKIKESIESGELAVLTHAAPQVYFERLNWNVWSKQVELLIYKLVEQNSKGV